MVGPDPFCYYLVRGLELICRPGIDSLCGSFRFMVRRKLRPRNKCAGWLFLQDVWLRLCMSLRLPRNPLFMHSDAAVFGRCLGNNAFLWNFPVVGSHRKTLTSVINKIDIRVISALLQTLEIIGRPIAKKDCQHLLRMVNNCNINFRSVSKTNGQTYTLWNSHNNLLTLWYKRLTSRYSFCKPMISELLMYIIVKQRVC